MLTEYNVLIPKHDNDRRRTDVASSILHSFVRYVSGHFGGCSVTEGEGCYIMKNGNLAVDKWWKVGIITGEADKIDAVIRSLVATVCKHLDQESVMVTKTKVEVEFASDVNTKDLLNV